MIRLGIISLDHPHSRGNHFPALKYMIPRVPVTAIYHDDEELTKPWLDIFGAKYYRTRDALLADPEIDAVLITSINNRHADDCIAAAMAGKAIFCDKPIATSVTDGLRIAEALEKNPVPFITTFPVRFNDTVYRTKRIVESGELGRIVAITATNHGCMYEAGAPAWVLDRVKNGGGCIIDHTVHVADLIRWISGGEFNDVLVYAKNAVHNYIEAEDIAVLHGTMSNGTIYQIDASWSRRPANPMWGDVTLRIVGEKGAAFLDLYNNQCLELYKEEHIEMQYPNLIAKEHGDIFDDYRLHVEQGRPLTGAVMEDGLRTVELVSAAYESLKQGKAVKVHRNVITRMPL